MRTLIWVLAVELVAAVVIVSEAFPLLGGVGVVTMAAGLVGGYLYFAEPRHPYVPRGYTREHHR